MTNHTPLTADEALVLQQLHEDGEDDTRMLARSMGLPRRYVLGLLAGQKRGRHICSPVCRLALRVVY